MDIRKIKAMLGFAIKSGNIIYGADNIETCRKTVYLILADSDLSKRSQESLEKIASNKKAAFIILTERLEDMVFKTNCKAVAVLDKNMADNIIKNMSDS